MTAQKVADRLVLYAYNEALMQEPYESKLWDKWRDLLDVVHYQVESAPGYLGRYKGENDPLGYIAPRWPGEPLIMGNLSAWNSLRELERFTFGPGTHGNMMKHRDRWFRPWPFERPHFVAWYGRADIMNDGTVVPHFDLDAALIMQAALHEMGPTNEVFGWAGPLGMYR